MDADINVLQALCDAKDAELYKAESEIERLRVQRDEARKTMREWSESCGAEVQRLRGLLREAKTIIDAATVEHFARVEVRDRKGLRGWSEHPMLGQITRWKEKIGDA